MMIRKHILGTEYLSQEKLESADVNQDGIISNENLSKTTIMSSGSKDKDGIKCTIKGTGKTNCTNY